jgi:RecA-family ATPase
MNKDVENAALEYMEAGLSVIPIVSGTKAPHGGFDLGSRFQDKSPLIADSEEIESWGMDGVGIVTGRASGIIVLDIDSQRGADLIREKYGAIASPIWQKTGKGWHLFFKYPGGNVPSKIGIFKHIDKDAKVDVKANGGYVVAAPTIHPNGSLYKMEKSLDWCDLPDCPAWMVGEVASDFVIKNGVLDLSPYRSLENVFQETEEGGRNNQMTAIVGSLCASSLDVDSVVRIALSCNQTLMIPPLEHNIVVSMVQRLYTKEAAKVDPDVAVGVLDDVETWDPEEINCARWLDKEPEETKWLVDGFLPIMPYGVVASKGGVGKGWLLFQLAQSIAYGVDFFGMTCEGGKKTLFINKEDPENQLHLRYQRCHMAQVGHGVQERRQIFCPDLMSEDTQHFVYPVDSTSLVKRIIKFSEKVDGLDLIVLDTLTKLTTDINHNDNADAGNVSNALNYIHKKTGAVILLVHHLNQDSETHGRSTSYNVRGATAFVDNARFVLQFGPASQAERDDYGIGAAENNEFVNMEVTKSNYGSFDGRQKWLLQKNTDPDLHGTFKLAEKSLVQESLDGYKDFVFGAPIGSARKDMMESLRQEYGLSTKKVKQVFTIMEELDKTISFERQRNAWILTKKTYENN